MRFMILVKADKNSEAGVLEFTPELREQEKRLRAQVEKRKGS